MKPVNKHHPKLDPAVYVTPTGNDATAQRGVKDKPCATLKKAVSLTQPGDGIIVASGVYVLEHFVKLPPFVNLLGVGLPTVNSLVDLATEGVAIVPGDRSVIDGFQINAAWSEYPPRFQGLIGSKLQGGFLDPVVQNCLFNGVSDVFFFADALNEKRITIRNCSQINSKWDAVQTFDSNITLTIDNCAFNVIGPSPLSESEPCHGIICRHKTTIRNCKIKVSGPNSGNRGVLNSIFGAGAVVSICGTTFDVTGPSDARDYEIHSGSTLIGPTPTCA